MIGWLFVPVYFWLPGYEILGDPFYATLSIEQQQSIYDEIAGMHIGLNVIAFVFFSAPSFVSWLLMIVNQKRVVEFLLAHDAPVNTSSGLIDD